MLKEYFQAHEIFNRELGQRTGDWLRNDVKGNKWEVLHLLNQATWNESNLLI